MSYTVKYAKNSLDDFNRGLNYYQEISLALAQGFETEFWYCIRLLKENPLAYQKRYLQIRIVKLNRFPFTIHFLVDDHFIYIQRVLHEKRNY